MLEAKIEALLFVCSRPLTVGQICNFLKKDGEEGATKEAVADCLKGIAVKFNKPESGIHLLTNGEEFRFVSNSEFGGTVKRFLKDDITGELTPAGLETLAVIAYRGPISKLDLEEIRGVNCSVILRNLMIRGLIDEKKSEDGERVFYRVTTDFVKHLGVADISQLPDFEKLNSMQIGGQQ
jgi:segregation and condensation protein B